MSDNGVLTQREYTEMRRGFIYTPAPAARVIESVHCTEVKEPKITRRFRPGQRRGKDKHRPTKVYQLPSVRVPAAYRIENDLVIHPALMEGVRRAFADSVNQQIEKACGLW